MNRWRTQFGPLTGGILLLAACAVPQKPQVLEIFFDGVTPEAQPVVAAAAPVSKEANARVEELYLAARSAPPGFRHKPYAEHECLTCHESEFSQKLRREVPALCQSCHPAIAKAKPFTHAPVAQGKCLVCHQPHQSMEPALLVGAGWKLCGGCHEEKQIAVTPTHAQAAGRKCQDCHDPHGGQDRNLLKQQSIGPTQMPAAVQSPS